MAMNTRTRNSAKNFSIGLVWEAVYVILNFVIRWTITRELGIGATSLNGLFVELIAMISLAELGVGTAITYQLYKPLKENDQKKLAELMTLFRNAYMIIAAVIFVAGLALMPLMDIVVTDVGFDAGYVRLVYALFVTQTAVSYLFSYKSGLLSADQQQRRVYSCNLISKFVFTALEILVLVLTKNYIAFLACEIVRTVALNLMISHAADKRYPFLRERAKLPREERRDIFKNIRHLFVSKLCARVTNSTDNLLISILIGTLTVGQYSQYALLSNGVFHVFSALKDSTAGSVGNSMVSEPPEKCRKILDRMTLLAFFAGAPLACCLFSLSTLFVENVFGLEYVIGAATVAVTSFNFFYSALKVPLLNFVGVSGRFAEDKNIALTGTLFNLLVSVLLTKLIGLPGIFIGTTATIVIQTELRMGLLGRCGLPMKGFRLRFELMCLMSVAEMVLCYFVVSKLVIFSWVLRFLAGAAISMLIPTSVNTLVFRATDEFGYIKYTVKRIVSRVLHKESEAN